VGHVARDGSAVEFEDFIVIGREIDIGRPPKIALFYVYRIDRNFDATIQQLAYIRRNGAKAHRGWKRYFLDKIIGNLVVELCVNQNPVIDKSQVQADIEFLAVLPPEIGVPDI